MNKYYGVYGVKFEKLESIVFLASDLNAAYDFLHECAVDEYQTVEGGYSYLDWRQVAEREGVDETEATSAELEWVDSRYSEEIETNIIVEVFPFDENDPEMITTFNEQDNEYWEV